MTSPMPNIWRLAERLTVHLFNQPIFDRGSSRFPQKNRMVRVMESMLVLKNLVKRYQAVYAVDGVSLDLPEGEFLTLLGPSGSGQRV